jgi:phospholipid N-methyltransferase
MNIQKLFWNKKNIVSKYLNIYDLLVNKINCKYVWKCDQRYIIDNYKKNIKNNHLEIGPGTGYFLKNIKNTKNTNLFLLDINNDTLKFSAKNLQGRFNNINSFNRNIFEDTIVSKTLPKINSVGVNYVLHCVPGNLEDKIQSLINNIGQSNINYFGASVVSNKELSTFVAKIELYFLNKFGIFNNKNDNYLNLVKYFEKNNIKYEIKIKGNVVIFNFIK